MLRTKIRMRLCAALLTVNLIFIWGNSLLPGDLSSALSQWVKDMLSYILPVGPSSSGSGIFLLRKLAHLTEFACLGLCLGWLFGMLYRRKLHCIGLPILCGFAAACVDETIQIFSPERGPGLRDVGIDTLGVALGIAALSLGQYIIKHNRRINK